MRLIDADEMKKILSEEITRKFVRWDRTITVAEWETFIQDIIDDAPTIKEMPEKYIIQVKTKEDAQRIKNVWDKSNFGNVIITADNFEVIPIRPQGKWLEDKVAFHFVCDQCGCALRRLKNEVFEGDYDYNFCPNCGAQMKTRTDAD